jgi:cyclophilin family peptidyl-prolyl cis-trans isomerase
LPDNPGYAFKDELPASSADYRPGTFMMDNAGPDTNGSQWMIMVQNQGIAPKFSIMGDVTDGLDTTVAAIDKTGSANGKPTAATTITKVTVTER